MAVYQVQMENQSRPVFSRWEGGALDPRTPVILQTDGGQAYGEVLEARAFMDRHVCIQQIVSTVRVATEEDRRRRQRHRQAEREAFVFCRDQAKSMNLQMKVVQVVMLFDESKLIFVYTAENRVDFRDLVRVLAHQFHMRIEMRQVGVRDEARILGGYGHCGRPLCCSGHLVQFYPITIRMAKDQGLSLNPVKISGRCGRLMCCLRYECAPSRPKPAPAPASAPEA